MSEYSHLVWHPVVARTMPPAGSSAAPDDGWTRRMRDVNTVSFPPDKWV